jgi:hypothetical protein
MPGYGKRARQFSATIGEIEMEEAESGAVADAQGDDSRQAILVKRWLLVVAILASLVGIPYTRSIITQRARVEQPASEILSELAENVLVESLISSFFIIIGIRLRRSLGLGVNLLNEWPPVDDAARCQVRNTIALAIALGVALGITLAVIDYFLEPMMPKPRRPLVAPPAWTGLLASFGAGIQEEIWMRLGMITIFVWLGSRIVRRMPPASGVVWTSNVLAALVFGSLHIPQAAVFLGPTRLVISYTLLGNAVPGVVFGWLYWRRGLVAAMVCHCAADVILKAVLPLLGIE